MPRLFRLSDSDSEPEAEPEIEAVSAAEADGEVVGRVAKINLFTNTAVPVPRYIELFGQPTCDHPWGDKFWRGFADEFHNAYLPASRQSWLRGMTPRYALFELPEDFSKRNAGLPPGPGNARSGRRYPCATFVTGPDEPEWIWVVCYNMLMIRSRAWWVHIDWITF
jgi:hypothetical protein